MRRYLTGLCALVLMATAVVVVDATPPASAADPETFDPAVLQTEPQFARWGVVGKGPNSHAGEDHGGVRDWTGPQPEVWDLEEYGDRVFVGGIFTGVRRNQFWWPNDPVHDQPFLAAFDRDTGDWISTWRPELDGVVYDVSVTDEGMLLVGGEFETVNGVARKGLVGLDPSTGEIVDTFQASVSREWSDDPAYVKEILVDGDDVYVGGWFSHVTDQNGLALHRSVVRLDAVTGERDTAWTVMTGGGSVWDLTIDEERGRVHLVGYFTSLDALPNTARFGTVLLSDGSAVAALPALPTNHAWNTDTVTITRGDDKTWVGGGNHLINVLDPATNVALFTQTVPGAGDIQVVERIGDTMALGHHGSAGGGIIFYDPETRLREPVNLGLVRRSYGVWAVEATEDGCLWVGGDAIRTAGGAWLGGIARFCPPSDVDGDGILDQDDTVETSGASISQDGVATQSSIYANDPTRFGPLVAIDANQGGQYPSDPVAITNPDAQPWWEVDLGGSYAIDGINVWNRTDSAGNRLDNAVVMISSSPFGNVTLAEAQAQSEWAGTIGDVGEVWQFGVPNVVGQYVRVQLPAAQYLQLAEVDVFGVESDLPPFGTPANVELSTNGVDQVTVSWEEVSNLKGYVIHRDFQFVKWLPAGSTSFVDETVQAGESYRYQVRAQAPDNSYSPPSPLQSISVTEPEDLPPFGTPNNVALETNGVDEVTVAWERVANTKGYVIHRDFQFVKWVSSDIDTWTDTDVLAGETYRYQVRAQAPDNSYSLPSPMQSITVFDDAGLPPFGTPSNHSVTTNGIDTVSLSWDPVADAKGYVIHRDFQFVKWVPFTETAWDDTDVTFGESYRYQIRAQATDNTYSAPTPTERVTVGDDVTPPDAPVGVVALRSADGTSITVTWDAAIDDVAVTSYLIHDNWNYLAWVPAGTTTYTHSGLDPDSVHRYQVRARDAADNTSAPSELIRVDPN